MPNIDESIGEQINVPRFHDRFAVEAAEEETGGERFGAGRSRVSGSLSEDINRYVRHAEEEIRAFRPTGEARQYTQGEYASLTPQDFAGALDILDNRIEADPYIRKAMKDRLKIEKSMEESKKSDKYFMQMVPTEAGMLIVGETGSYLMDDKTNLRDLLYYMNRTPGFKGEGAKKRLVAKAEIRAGTNRMINNISIANGGSTDVVIFIYDKSDHQT